ncbi:HEPN domain-containing protein [Neorhizobium sp. NPDC001467]|uniref:HEPN domain-containing protein n=1 Tax=Neorhizobium sp. NPDC001467 TaxID=3390595 RepID=UPI003D0116FE
MAHDDLEAAQALAAIENRNDAYHAQQAAEKILIALLTSEGIKADRKDAHRPDVLQGLLPDANPFKHKFKPVLFLTIYATTYRYPKDAGRLPAKADSHELGVAMNTIRQLLNEAATHFGVGLTDSDKIPAACFAAPRH